MSNPSRVTILFLAAACLTAPATAQQWTPIGPPGGDVRSLALDPRRPGHIYLGTADGIVYKSTDGADHWERMESAFPLRGRSLDDIVVDPATGEIWIGYWEVAGPGGGVAHSTDGGRTFAVLPGIEGQAVRALAQSPSHPAILVAGTLSGVFRSEDRGATWSRVSPAGHPEIRNVNSIAIDPRDPGVIYAGTWHLPWKTLDGGRRWSPIAAGMIADSDVFTMNVDRRDPRSVFATACSGIYRSLDAGGRWTKIRGIPSSSRRTRAFSQHPARPEVLLAGTTEGLWMSEDGSATWRLATEKQLVVNAVVVLPGGAILLGCDGAGVRRSLDQGTTWTSANHGFSERFVSRILVEDGGRLLAGIREDRKHGGVLAAAGLDGPWAPLGNGLQGREVLTLERVGPNLLAGTDDGVFLLPSGGEHWLRLPTVIAGVDRRPKVADIAGWPDGRLLVATTDGIFVGVEWGLRWERPDLGVAAVTAVGIAPGRPGVALAVTPLHVFRTEDGGRTWAAVSSTPGRGHAVHIAGNGTVFLGSDRGLYRSHDGGRQWLRCRGGLPDTDIGGLAVSDDGRSLYASDFTRGGLYRSDDGGDRWREVSTTGLRSSRLWSVAVIPGTEMVLASAPTGGLHVLRGTTAGPLTGGGQGASQ